MTVNSLDQSSNAATIIDTGSTPINFVTPGDLSGTISIIPGSSITSDVVQYTFQFTSTNPTPSTGAGLLISLPKGIFGFPTPTVTTSNLVNLGNVNPTATITLSSSALYDYISISNCLVASKPAGTIFTFKLSAIKNPPTIQSVPGIYFTTLTTAGYVIDTNAISYTLSTVVNPHQFNYVNIWPFTLENGRTGAYYVDLTLKENHYTNDYILLQFPTQLVFTLSTVTFGALTTSGISILGTPVQISNSVQIQINCVPNPAPAGSRIYMLITNVKNNIIDGAISSFTVTSMDIGLYNRAQTINTNASLITSPALL